MNSPRQIHPKVDLIGNCQKGSGFSMNSPRQIHPKVDLIENYQKG